MQTGKVKWFNEEKGFGFISGKSGDYFVHYKDIVGEGFKKLAGNQTVEFTVAQGPKGECAKNVKVIGNV